MQSGGKTNKVTGKYSHSATEDYEAKQGESNSGNATTEITGAMVKIN